MLRKVGHTYQPAPLSSEWCATQLAAAAVDWPFGFNTYTPLYNVTHASDPVSGLYASPQYEVGYGNLSYAH